MQMVGGVRELVSVGIGLTVMVIAFDVAGLPVAQERLDVMIT